MTGLYILLGGIALFAFVINLLDIMAQRRKPHKRSR